MTNCLFYSLFFALFLNISFGSLRISQVNRVFMSIYKGMLEASILTISNKGEPIYPYFNEERLEAYVDDYLKENISRYTTRYSVSTQLLMSNGDYCDSICRKVEITLSAKIYTFYHYNKTQTFVIGSASQYE